VLPELDACFAALALGDMQAASAPQDIAEDTA
jgi:hypothetical protein